MLYPWPSTAFRVDAPEFTPKKLNIPTAAPHRPRTSRAATATDGNHPGATRAMENRLWPSEDLSEEMSLYNHWLLASSAECGIMHLLKREYS